MTSIPGVLSQQLLGLPSGPLATAVSARWPRRSGADTYLSRYQRCYSDAGTHALVAVLYFTRVSWDAFIVTWICGVKDNVPVSPR